jgi:5-methyltetrahydrofolate--homocysteine methyltransferase
MVLGGFDKQCADYVAKYADAATSQDRGQQTAAGTDVQSCVIKGYREQTAKAVESLLKEKSALDIVNEELVPALNVVGEGFEKGTMFLPQLLMSAEAAKAGFEVIKEHMQKEGQVQASKAKIVLATVKGDIHDIGKNIVKVLLENYGYEVIDLGKDVPAEVVVEAVVTNHAPMAGLSALMTTTVVNMEETVRLLHEKAPWCKVIVGGAVLSQDYAEQIGADFFAKDAMQTVHFAEEFINLS